MEYHGVLKDQKVPSSFVYPLPLQKVSFISPTSGGRETTFAFKLPARPIILEFIDVIVV